MTETLNPIKPILGYTDTETVKFDLDDMPFSKVKELAIKTMERFNLEGFLILKSSKNCYHVVFNRSVDWSENMRIVAWVAILSKSVSALKYQAMQSIKMSSTLRISPKGDKPSPRIVFRFGNQDNAIKAFLEFRKVVKKMALEFL